MIKISLPKSRFLKNANERLYIHSNSQNIRKIIVIFLERGEPMSIQTENDSILEMYITETSQLVEQLEELILEGEESRNFSENVVNEIFRIMHTIKGSSAMMQHDNIAALAHSLEDIFSFIREEKLQLTDFTTLSDLMLESVDFIKVEVQKAKNLDAVDGDASFLIQNAKSYLASLKNGQEDKINNHPVQDQQDSSVGDLIMDNSNTNSNLFHITVFFEDGCEMENVRAFQIVHRLKEYVGEYHHIPENIEEHIISTETIRKQGFQLFIRTEKSYEEIHKLVSQSSFLKQVTITKLQSPKEKGHNDWHTTKEHISPHETISKEEHHSNYHNQASFINVNVLKLDELMDLVGELVIAEAMVTQNPDLNGLQLEQFQKAARHLQKITNEIQDKVMTIRLVPLANTFHKMNRVVRDMCKKLGKNVHLDLIGEETEVDKSIIEHISDPLMHLVRNALDHGMETSQERIAKGKAEIGTITLEAKNAGGEVIIYIKDDGRGLNKNKILEKARKNQLLTKNEEEMTDKEIYHLILLPGLSTKEKITEFSGRGVGMDVVVQNITAVGGSVSVDSVPNQGTTILMRIPLTLAIIDGMNVRVGHSYYTLPTTAIKESFKPGKNDVIKDPDGNEMIMIRGQCFPIIRLHKFFEIKTATAQIFDGVLIMVEQDEQCVCLFVDELLGQQQVVVKSLPQYIKRIKNIESISGCSLLGDGSISLILDIQGLTKARRSTKGAER